MKWILTEETRKKMSEAKKGKPRDEETRKKISAGKLKYKLTDEHKAHIREANARKDCAKVCKGCGKEFMGRGSQLYCTRKCRYSSQNEEDTQ